MNPSTSKRIRALAVGGAGIAAAFVAGGWSPIGSASAGPSAATACPPFGFVAPIPAANPSFEVVGPNGSPTVWHNGDPTPAPSAAKGWFMHSSNSGDTVRSELVPTNVPGPGGTNMLHFIAGGNEGGVYQNVPGVPQNAMFSVWVYVRRGHVAVQENGGVTGPVAWSTKHNQWEQLRVCSDGTVPVDSLVIYNEDPDGGDFYVDRVEFWQTA